MPAAPAVINAIENALGVEINDLPYRFGVGAPAPREKEET